MQYTSSAFNFDPFWDTKELIMHSLCKTEPPEDENITVSLRLVSSTVYTAQIQWARAKLRFAEISLPEY